MPIIDANVILRYLLQDIPDQAEEARKIIMAGAFATVEVLAEVVYVLINVYHADRDIVSGTLGAFIQEIEVPDKASLQYAFRLFKNSRFDFVDCILAGYHYVTGSDVITFDKKLQKCLQTNPLQD